MILPRHRCHRAAPDAAGLKGNETRVLQRAETGIGVAAGGSTAAAARWLRASHARLGKEEGGAMQETASVAAPLAAVARERWCAAAATATRGGAGRGHAEIRRRHGLLCRHGEGMGNKMDEIQGLEMAGGCLVLDRANIVSAGFKTTEKFGR
jgi:hypothetical protein